ncbi:hypothetical protein XHV734_2563 [Xanthomonas hortorum pv. vitians]|nr:hypothetical protein XHV734_2563 [Xanthomonas hortorum pv. vitians]
MSAYAWRRVPGLGAANKPWREAASRNRRGHRTRQVAAWFCQPLLSGLRTRTRSHMDAAMLEAGA